MNNVSNFMNHVYDVKDDGSCIRIRLDGEIVAIVEDYYFGGHVHAAFRQLLDRIKSLETSLDANDSNYWWGGQQL